MNANPAISALSEALSIDVGKIDTETSVRALYEQYGPREASMRRHEELQAFSYERATEDEFFMMVRTVFPNANLQDEQIRSLYTGTVAHFVFVINERIRRAGS
jgi:hypothetical protein